LTIPYEFALYKGFLLVRRLDLKIYTLTK
jgi:hypothetical protein